MAKTTNLTNTYWNIPAGWTAAAGYGRFNVEISIDENGEGIGGYERFEVGYTIDADEPSNSLTKANCVTFGPYSFWEYDNSKTFQIRFNGGADVTNTSLITWLEANGEMEGGETESDVVTVTYKDTTIAIEAGKTITLHTTDKKFTEDLEIMASESTVEDWDGTIVVEGGTISFTINSKSYEAEEGMIWGAWVESEYNTGGYVESGDVIKNSNGWFVKLNGNSVFVYDVIVEGATYELMVSGGSID